MALSCIDSDQITDVKVRDDLLDLIGNSTCEGMTQDFYTAISVMYILLYNNLTGQNNCWKNWIKCAGKLAACAAECMNNTTSQSCISCLTPLYSECKYCFSEIEESQKSGNKMQYTICCICNCRDWNVIFLGISQHHMHALNF